MVWANCLKVQQGKVIPIDEQIVPSKTKRSGIRQCNPKEPVKWGFKMFVKVGTSGIVYNFFLHSGIGSVGTENCSSEGSVM